MAPWADALFAIDANWWSHYIEEVQRDFRGATYSCNDFYGRVGLVSKPFKAFGNSGAGAIALAVKAGASRVILLGYDCQKSGGKVHWHGDHPYDTSRPVQERLGNAGSMPKWAEKFQRLSESLSGLEVINCSRETALKAFPCGSLETVLGEG